MLDNHNFSVIVHANFLSGGNYRYHGKRFYRLFAKDPQSLYDFIINNQDTFRNYIKSKRNKGNKLLIRKSDNYDFLTDFELNQIRETSFSYTVHYDFNYLYFTDCGIITLNEWISLNEEHII